MGRKGEQLSPSKGRWIGNETRLPKLERDLYYKITKSMKKRQFSICTELTVEGQDFQVVVDVAAKLVLKVDKFPGPFLALPGAQFFVSRQAMVQRLAYLGLDEDYHVEVKSAALSALKLQVLFST